MAPVEPQSEAYFPGLAKCFSGEHQLLSWKTTLSILCDLEDPSRSQVLRSFFSDATALAILSEPFNPFPAPSTGTKNKFETETAPINVTSSSGGNYSIEEIKADTLWLSGQTQIDELSALRIVVLEWQTRPEAQLLSGFTEEEALSIQDAAGTANLGMSSFLANSSILAASSGPSAQSIDQFDRVEQRRLRIVQVYLEERKSILRTSQILISFSDAGIPQPELRLSEDTTKSFADWMKETGARIIARRKAANRPSIGDPDFLPECTQAIEARVGELEKEREWDLPADIRHIVADGWVQCQVTEMVHIFQFALVHVDGWVDELPSRDTVIQWFGFMDATGFFHNAAFPPSTHSLIPLLHLLISNISLVILKLPTAIAHVTAEGDYEYGSQSYVLDADCVSYVHHVLHKSVQTGPGPWSCAAFAWSIIFSLAIDRARDPEDEDGDVEEDPLYNGPAIRQSPIRQLLDQVRQRPLEDQNSAPFDEQILGLAAISGDKGMIFNLVLNILRESITYFATSIDVVTLRSIRFALFDLPRIGLGTTLVLYCPEVIETMIAAVSGGNAFWTWVDREPQLHADPLVDVLLRGNEMDATLLEEATCRYPYETVPLLKLCRALMLGEQSAHESFPPVAIILSSVSRFTQEVSKKFTGFASIREEENANHIASTADLKLFTTGGEIIPEGTQGNIVYDDERDERRVIVWNYQHSALQYLVSLLSTFIIRSKHLEQLTGERTSLENASEIIGFLADVLFASIKSGQEFDNGQRVPAELLEMLNITLEGQRGRDGRLDTVAIVFTIFEQELLQQVQQPGTEGSLELLVNCTHFIDAIILIAPARVWPLLARSRLLEHDGNSGCLAAILVGTEIVIGRYDFLVGCIRVFESLVEDVVVRSASRKAPSKALTRFGSPALTGSGTSEKSMSTLLLTFGKTLTSIFESSPSWRYVRAEDRPEINIRLSGIFNELLHYVYGVDDSRSTSSKLTRLLAPTAEYIMELFLSTSDNDLQTDPFLAPLLSAADNSSSTIRYKGADRLLQQTQSTLTFANTLVQVGILLEKPWSRLEKQLFKAAPLLARLYASNDVYKSSVTRLLESLVRGATRGASEPPSLLGHLGARTAKSFLSILSTLGKPLQLEDVEVNIWKLLSAVVSCKQQWFAIYLLTGSTPRDSLKKKEKEASRGKALLEFALDELSQVDMNGAERTVAMLEFVELAQNNWSWAMGTLRQHKKFVPGLLSFLRGLKTTDTPRTETNIVRTAEQNKIAALISRILAMYLHSSRQNGDHSMIKDVIPSLEYLQQTALALPAYNSSLHANLKKNFENKFQGCSLESFKRTTLTEAPLGRDYFYDLEFAEKLLSFDASWEPQRGDGFSTEFLRANLNLSLVESQILLLKGWQLLAVELSQVVKQEKGLEKILVSVVKDCLVANAESQLPEALFGRLMLLRMDLAFVVIQKLVLAKAQDEGAQELFSVAWETIRTSGLDFETSFATGQTDYYRSLLKILFLTLQFRLDTFQSPNANLGKSFRHAQRGLELTPTLSNQFLEILSEVVAKGFRALASQLHSNPSACTPSDFGLITGILQVILRIPEMSNWHSQAALQFSNSNTARYAATLFSWADKLAISHDPIYGELSILFLLELSTMNVMAETLAVEGILAQLNSANLMTYFQRPGGMGPFDEPDRIYSIWTRGILPLCLNLLHGVGQPVAGEVAAFLNQYPKQLERASNALHARITPTSSNPNAGRITLSMASEAHSLALISLILETFRQGPAAGEIPGLEWEREAVKEDVEGWLSDGRVGLRERISPASEKEVEWGRQGPSGSAGKAQTLLEERVMGELEAALGCLNGGV